MIPKLKKLKKNKHRRNNVIEIFQSEKGDKAIVKVQGLQWKSQNVLSTNGENL